MDFYKPFKSILIGGSKGSSLLGVSSIIPCSIPTVFAEKGLKTFTTTFSIRNLTSA